MTTNFWDGYTFEVDKQDQVYQADIHSLSLNAPNLKSKVTPADVDFIQPNLPPANMASLFSQLTAAAANMQFVDAVYQPSQPNMIKLNEDLKVQDVPQMPKIDLPIGTRVKVYGQPGSIVNAYTHKVNGKKTYSIALDNDLTVQAYKSDIEVLNESKAVKEYLPSKAQELTVHEIVEHIADAFVDQDIIAKVHTFKDNGDPVSANLDGLHIDCNDGYGSTFTITVEPV